MTQRVLRFGALLGFAAAILTSSATSHADDPALHSHQQRILGLLGEEVEKVLQEQLGETVHYPEAQHPIPPDRSMGMHI